MVPITTYGIEISTPSKMAASETRVEKAIFNAILETKVRNKGLQSRTDITDVI